MGGKLLDGYVYLFRLGEFHKIGCSEDPERRLADFMNLPYPGELVHLIESSTAFDIEQNLHDFFQDKRVKGEWFRLDQADIDILRSLIRLDIGLSSPLLPGTMRAILRVRRKKTLYVDLDAALKRRLEAIALRHGRSLAAETEILMQRYLDVEEKKEGITPPPRPSDDSDE